MRIDVIERGNLLTYNLGGREPPANTLAKLRERDKALELIWNTDRWEVYRVTRKGVTDKDDELTWQISAPVLGTEITPALATWLGKYDTTEGGKRDTSYREKEWLKLYGELRYNDEKKTDKEIAERMYESHHINKYLTRVMAGNRQIVKPAFGGQVKGKMAYAFRRSNVC